jgi:DinB superfamily
MERCRECGFAYVLDRAPDSGPAIVQGVAALAVILTDGGQSLMRPEPRTWSPLEYGCHVRDVLLVQRERVLAARRIDCPSFDAMGRDERVEHDGYAQQQPADVARQLTDAAGLFANVIARLGPLDWERTAIYGYPERRERSLRWVAVHTEHEVRHHLLDVRHNLG